MATLVIGTGAQAQDVFITQDMPWYEAEVGDSFVMIERNQDTEARIVDDFARTSRPCPPFCIQPFQVAEGVTTVGELELIAFIEEYVVPGNGLLIDSRLTDWFDGGTIPGAVNLPFNLFTPSNENPFLDPLLRQFGGQLRSNGTWDFAEARELMMFCNGPWCGQSPTAIRNLLELGYPAEKLRYYRGGMQNWLMLGLTVEVPATG
ncbi:rhodanese-like domain-containing protein [Roseobacter sp. HKCCA0434]|uniref:rhodanese-like domain-containing protein n=1 Tax=Roseobacter sp. HKCCA0434 TaxID=3079297 RepID=UPI002905D762|nr:rhodanese-like domain-containing protein [Roseobacter sp. HKCCA0434]